MLVKENERDDLVRKLHRRCCSYINLKEEKNPSSLGLPIQTSRPKGKGKQKNKKQKIQKPQGRTPDKWCLSGRQPSEK